ncbi:MFS general substrate transporter [Violaceomyces palustris]|uniref:MFS general substrate transporter n=1 Tax=Violaceomyces palustris TaxID=1673888 RepID=A0ACD0NTJ3_9BASI|nr:MFS general substrate transporter [Violaceomyces palustris]
MPLENTAHHAAIPPSETAKGSGGGSAGRASSTFAPPILMSGQRISNTVHTTVPPLRSSILSPLKRFREGLVGRASRPWSSWLADSEPGMPLKEAGLLMAMILMGWIDATPGALVPAIRQHYSIDFIVVSMLFVSNLGGLIVAAFLTSFLLDRVGFGKTLSIAAACGTIAPIIFVTRPPFAVLVVSMPIAGMSSGMIDALANNFMSVRPRASVRLGALHFVYGLGAFLCPMAAIPFTTQIDGKKGNGIAFNYFYSITLCLAILSLVLVSTAFKLQREEIVEHGRLADEQQPNGSASPVTIPERRNSGEDIVLEALSAKTEAWSAAGLIALPQIGETAAAEVPRKTKHNTGLRFKQMLQRRDIWTLALFTLFYVGTEVSIGGWSTSFLIEVRNETNTSNLLVSGFWAGIALGRVLLLPVTSWLGDEWAVMVYFGLSIGLQVIVWTVPNVVANAVSLAFQGFFLGPIFPIMVHVASRRIRPRSLFTPGLSFIISFGAAGSALFPLIVGIAAEKASKGIEILAPILIALLSVQVLIWIQVGVPLPWKRQPAAAEQDRED